uniref:RanBP2-type domain-containing protein n=2 Tax=Globodera pallida TaxID=36090 RepID=A0A183BPR8_GLOPA
MSFFNRRSLLPYASGPTIGGVGESNFNASNDWSRTQKRGGGIPSLMSESAQWTCYKCFINNFNGRSNCFKCGTPRTSGEAMALDAKGLSMVGALACDTLLFRELPASASDASVRQAVVHFAGAEPLRVRLAVSRLFAFVQMPSLADAEIAHLKLQRMCPYIDNCAVLVSFSRHSLDKVLGDGHVELLPECHSLDGGGGQKSLGLASSSPVSTPFGFLPTFPSPDPSQFKYELSSSYYYDQRTGFYFDPKTKFFYCPKSKSWKFWCQKYRTYIDCEGDDMQLKRRLQEDERCRVRRAEAAPPPSEAEHRNALRNAPPPPSRTLAAAAPGGSGGGGIKPDIFSPTKPGGNRRPLLLELDDDDDDGGKGKGLPMSGARAGQQDGRKKLKTDGDVGGSGVHGHGVRQRVLVDVQAVGGGQQEKEIMALAAAKLVPPPPLSSSSFASRIGKSSASVMKDTLNESLRLNRMMIAQLNNQRVAAKERHQSAALHSQLDALLAQQRSLEASIAELFESSRIGAEHETVAVAAVVDHQRLRRRSDSVVSAGGKQLLNVEDGGPHGRSFERAAEPRPAPQLKRHITRELSGREMEVRRSLSPVCLGSLSLRLQKKKIGTLMENTILSHHHRQHHAAAAAAGAADAGDGAATTARPVPPMSAPSPPMPPIDHSFQPKHLTAVANLDDSADDDEGNLVRNLSATTLAEMHAEREANGILPPQQQQQQQQQHTGRRRLSTVCEDGHAHGKMVALHDSKVLVLYTGGTIGMRTCPAGGIVPSSSKQFFAEPEHVQQRYPAALSSAASRMIPSMWPTAFADAVDEHRFNQLLDNSQQQKKRELANKEREKVNSLGICLNCGRHGHSLFQCRWGRISDDALQKKLREANLKLQRQELDKQELKRKAENFPLRRKDPLIERLRVAAPEGKIKMEHIRMLCPRCAHFNHKQIECSRPDIGRTLHKQICTQLEEFKKAFFVHLQEDKMVDLSQKFDTFRVMDGIELNGTIDPVGLQLHGMCPDGFVTQMDLRELCSNCAQLGHKRIDCKETECSRTHFDKMLTLIKGYRALVKEGSGNFLLPRTNMNPSALVLKDIERSEPIEEILLDSSSDEEEVVEEAVAPQQTAAATATTEQKSKEEENVAGREKEAPEKQSDGAEAGDAAMAAKRAEVNVETIVLSDEVPETTPSSAAETTVPSHKVITVSDKADEVITVSDETEAALSAARDEMVDNTDSTGLSSVVVGDGDGGGGTDVVVTVPDDGTTSAVALPPTVPDEAVNKSSSSMPTPTATATAAAAVPEEVVNNEAVTVLTEKVAEQEEKQREPVAPSPVVQQNHSESALHSRDEVEEDDDDDIIMSCD